MTLLLVWTLYSIGLSIALARYGARPAPGAASPATAPRPNRVLIVGATGGTGRQLVAQALERGYDVTAFVRNPSALKVDHPRLRIVPGNVLDYASVEQAVRGRDAVISALGHNRYFGPSRILSEGTRNVLRAMQAHGVRRFVCETALGIGSGAWRMGVLYTFLVTPMIVPFYFWDKTRQEQLIAASGLDWVIVRPGALTNGEKRGRYRHGPRVGSLLLTLRISRADVADFMLNQTADNQYLRSAPGVCG